MPLSMPARLADGLGLKGALASGCPVAFAPSDSSLEEPEFGSPAPGFWSQPGFGEGPGIAKTAPGVKPTNSGRFPPAHPPEPVYRVPLT